MLGVYFLGGLDQEQEAPVERHLSRCEECLGDYGEHGDIPQYLDALAKEDVEELALPRGHMAVGRDDMTASGDKPRPTPS